MLTANQWIRRNDEIPQSNYFIECTFKNIMEQQVHQNYWNFALEAIGENPGTCELCGRKLTEPAYVWGTN